jgi:hypothetical protein
MATATVSFQSSDQSDVFYVAQLFDSNEVSDESLLSIEDPQFDSDKPWVTGKIPQMTTVNVEGDTSIIHGWLKADAFDKAFVVRVYLACELAEELQEVISEESEVAKESITTDYLQVNDLLL